MQINHIWFLHYFPDVNAVIEGGDIGNESVAVFKKSR